MNGPVRGADTSARPTAPSDTGRHWPNLTSMARHELEQRIADARRTLYDLSGWPSIHRPAIDDLLQLIQVAREELERPWPTAPTAPPAPPAPVESELARVAASGSAGDDALPPASGLLPGPGPDRGNEQGTGLLPVRCPTCQGTNVGTEEALTATALVSGYDPQLGEFEYAETIVDYESSVTQVSDDGQTIMFCRDCCGHFLFDPPTPTPPTSGVDKLPHMAENRNQ
jgi:hypothetical protein